MDQKINNNIDAKTLSELGEKTIVKEITSFLSVDERLIGGFGGDSAIISFGLENEFLLVNTDRSGMNIAYKLGLSDGSCVGDFAVSHAVSDIYASGGTPYAISIALMLPENLTLKFVKEVMKGAQEAANKYGAFIASGDTKQASKFSAVVTAIGKCKPNNVLTRSGAKPGDLLVITGNLGTMLSGLIAIKQGLNISDDDLEVARNSIIYQNPPHNFPREMFDNSVLHAGMDNSDGLISSIYSLCEQSNLGVILYEDKVPYLDITKKIAAQIHVSPFQLCLGSGDWQHLFAVKREFINKILSYANQSDTKLTVIGEFTDTAQVAVKTNNGLYSIKRIENDRFGIGGASWFDYLSRKINYIGEKIS